MADDQTSVKEPETDDEAAARTVVTRKKLREAAAETGVTSRIPARINLCWWLRIKASRRRRRLRPQLIPVWMAVEDEEDEEESGEESDCEDDAVVPVHAGKGDTPAPPAEPPSAAKVHMQSAAVVPSPTPRREAKEKPAGTTQAWRSANPPTTSKDKKSKDNADKALDSVENTAR